MLLKIQDPYIRALSQIRLSHRCSWVLAPPQPPPQSLRSQYLIYLAQARHCLAPAGIWLASLALTFSNRFEIKTCCRGPTINSRHLNSLCCSSRNTLHRTGETGTWTRTPPPFLHTGKTSAESGKPPALAVKRCDREPSSAQCLC